MKLSTLTVTALQPRINKNGKFGFYRVGDGRNLYVQVSPTGAKSWVYLYRAGNGKQRELGLGSFTGDGAAVSVSLKDARLAADKVRAQLAAGTDPIDAKTAIKAAAKVDVITFASILDLVIANEKINWKLNPEGGSDNENQWRSSMANYAAKLLDMPVAKVGEDEVLDVLRPIWKTIPMTADRVRFRINAVIEHATIKRLYVGPNPARTKALIDVLLGKAEVAAVVNQPSLPYAELPAVVALLRAKKGIAAKATLFTTLTAVRTDEARLALKSEVNFDTKLWLVPAARVKGKKGEANSPERIVPLSDAAIEVLRTLQDSDSIYLFPGTKEGQTLNPSSLNDMLVKPKAKGCLDLKGKATMHGMRASFSTWANEQLTFDKDAIELCLAHVVGTKVSRAYNRSEKLAERTRIMQAWGNYCFGISNLVQLERAA